MRSGNVGAPDDVAEQLQSQKIITIPVSWTAWTHGRMVRCMKLNGAATDPGAPASRPGIGD